MTIRRPATGNTTPQTSSLRPPNRTDLVAPARRPGEGGSRIRAVLQSHNVSRGPYPEIKASETEQILAFMQPDSFAALYFHWVDDAPKGTRKSWLCLKRPSSDVFVGGEEGDDRGCPLCDCKKLDKREQFRAYFNVVLLADWDRKTPEVAVLEAGITLTTLIADAHESERSGPINRTDIAFALSRTSTGEGSNLKYTFQLPPLKARDLWDDCQVQPLNDDQREMLLPRCYTSEQVVKRDTYEDLVRVVADCYGG